MPADLTRMRRASAAGYRIQGVRLMELGRLLIHAGENMMEHPEATRAFLVKLDLDSTGQWLRDLGDAFEVAAKELSDGQKT